MKWVKIAGAVFCFFVIFVQEKNTTVNIERKVAKDDVHVCVHSAFFFRCAFVRIVYQKNIVVHQNKDLIIAGRHTTIGFCFDVRRVVRE